jgi:UDP-glucose 4-epimerase
MDLNSSILVTGGAGYIGSKVVKDLINKNFNVIVVDNLSTGYKKLIQKKAIFYKCNIANKNKISQIIKINNVKTIFHFAASLNVAESYFKPKKYNLNNYEYTKRLLDLAQKLDVENFIFSSTCAVYDENLKKVTENSKKKPKSNYGKSKLKAERYIQSKVKKNFNFAILRYFNVAGADIKNKIGCINQTGQLVKNLSQNIAAKNYFIDVYGNNYKTKDGTCIRDYVLLDDISKIHIASLEYLMKNKKNIILNCGYGKGYSVLDVIKEFEKNIRKKININFKKKRKGDLSSVVCDTKKIKKLLGINLSKSPMKKIVKTSIQWEQSR